MASRLLLLIIAARARPLRSDRVRQRRPAARHRGGLDARRGGPVRAPRTHVHAGAQALADRLLAHDPAAAKLEDMLERAGARRGADGRAARARDGGGARTACPPRPGALELLEGLAAAGMPMAVASNSTRTFVERTLAGAGLLDGRFATIVTADDVDHPKPAPDLYLAACAALDADAHRVRRARGLAARRRLRRRGRHVRDRRALLPRHADRRRHAHRGLAGRPRGPRRPGPHWRLTGEPPHRADASLRRSSGRCPSAAVAHGAASAGCVGTADRGPLWPSTGLGRRGGRARWHGGGAGPLPSPACRPSAG